MASEFVLLLIALMNQTVYLTRTTHETEMPNLDIVYLLMSRTCAMAFGSKKNIFASALRHPLLD